jgi:formylglycine-generating enzyme required for sulfatase activity
MVSPVGGTRVRVVSVQGVAETALHWGGGWSERRRRRRRFHAGDTSPMHRPLVFRGRDRLAFRDSCSTNGLLTVLKAARSGCEVSMRRFPNLVSLLTGLCLAIGVPGPPASAQTPAGLDIQMYAGLTITGSVGTVYSIEYVTDLAQTNNPSAWRCLEFLQLPANPYLWADKSGPATRKRFYRAVEFPAPTNMVFIPPGAFRMGSPTDEVGRDEFEGPQMEVTISRGYWMGKYEVTQGEYLPVMGTNPSFYTGDSNRPVEKVSWNNATNYCSKFTRQERATGRIPTNGVCRLPTEAEWEYACRAWTSTRFSYGDDPGYTNLTDYAWYVANWEHSTHPVGQKLPNPRGLQDMHGNVWEWCSDWAGRYPGGIVLDPQGPATGSFRVVRGGSCAWVARGCRSAVRSDGYDPPGGVGIGFRVVLAPGPP